MSNHVTIISSDTHAGGKILDYNPILNHDGTMNLKSGNPDTRTHSETCRKALLKVAREIVTGTKPANNRTI